MNLNGKCWVVLFVFVVTFCFSSILHASSPPAEPTHYRITDTSNVTFTGSTALFSFDGTAEEVGGTVYYQPDNPSESRASVTVPVESMTTFNSWRDEDMYEMFESSSYPEIRFRTESISTSTVNNYDTGVTLDVQVTGPFGIHGVKRAETIPLSVTVDRERLVAEADFKINIKNYGITPPSVMMVSQVSPTVDVEIELVATRSEQ